MAKMKKSELTSTSARAVDMGIFSQGSSSSKARDPPWIGPLDAIAVFGSVKDLCISKVAREGAERVHQSNNLAR